MAGGRRFQMPRYVTSGFAVTHKLSMSFLQRIVEAGLRIREHALRVGGACSAPS
jgi:hypothetical protein